MDSFNPRKLIFRFENDHFDAAGRFNRLTNGNVLLGGLI